MPWTEEGSPCRASHRPSCQATRPPVAAGTVVTVQFRPSDSNRAVVFLPFSCRQSAEASTSRVTRPFRQLPGEFSSEDSTACRRFIASLAWWRRHIHPSTSLACPVDVYLKFWIQPFKISQHRVIDDWPFIKKTIIEDWSFQKTIFSQSSVLFSLSATCFTAKKITDTTMKLITSLFPPSMFI